MTPTVAILAPGEMGAGVGARLAEHGVKVLTALDGRSAASRKRAQAAHMAAATDGEIANADFVLSIVPPKEALPVARRLAPALREANRKPLYVECNAVSPQTVRDIARVVEETGSTFADAGIIGAPPKPGQAGPRFYVSGPEAQRMGALGRYGLTIKAMDGEIGDASALKLCYATLTKGFTALGAASAAAASRAGVADALQRELAASQPAMLAYLTRAVPTMFSKAYRWVGEMEEIAQFYERTGERTAFEGIAALYERLAQDQAGPQAEIDVLAKFFAQATAEKL